ncbi:54S ribosomal protein img2, mitochondrial [Diatrype stigma]|uniref:Large ribosomal subunit protein mL49 n=1 Tax=Diatrype stigma TaxID=117547 RepID=A0AAN9YT73_9PEZI
MFPRLFRPLRAPSASLIQTPIRFLLPLRTRTFATSNIETHAAASSPESSPLASSPESATVTATTPPTFEAPAPAPAAAEAATPSAAIPSEEPAAPTKIITPRKPSALTEEPDLPPRKLPYFVGRNPFNNFGVYQRRKRGGNLKVTLVKKGEGNLQALKHDIKKALDLRDDEVAVNSITRHIVVKVSYARPLSPSMRP